MYFMCCIITLLIVADVCQCRKYVQSQYKTVLRVWAPLLILSLLALQYHSYSKYLNKFECVTWVGLSIRGSRVPQALDC